MGETHRELRSECNDRRQRCTHLPWAVELDPSAAANAAGAAADQSLQTAEPAVQELAEQLYTVLMSLTDAGAGEGLEAWRPLHRRWDPLTTGRARGLPIVNYHTRCPLSA
eukprot:3677763-Amphidinium_carterae.1